MYGKDPSVDTGVYYRVLIYSLYTEILYLCSFKGVLINCDVLIDYDYRDMTIRIVMLQPHSVRRSSCAACSFVSEHNKSLHVSGS